MQSIFMKARTSLEKRREFAHGAVPEKIADSWHRCLRNGLDPIGDPVDAMLSHQDLYETKQRHEKLISIVRPELELLSNQIAGTNYMTAFADSGGVVLDAIMDNEFSQSHCSQSIQVGSIWTEEVRGTNALGLALHTGNTSMVTGGEHFFAKHGAVSCVSTPIFSSKGVIVGMLDASSEVAARQFHTQALVALAASNIENRLFIDEHRDDNIIQFHPREEYLTTQSVGMISVDADGNITGVNRRSGEILNGLNLSTTRSFSDLFQGGFSNSIKSLENGEVIRVTDWLNSTYFARIRITRRKLTGAGPKHMISLSVPSVFSLPNAPESPVFRDEQVSNSLRVALRSARVGLPFIIVGEPGTGRTTLAQTIHDELHKHLPLIVVDCQTANSLGEPEGLMANVFGGDDDKKFSIQTGGTLLLENLQIIHGGAAEELAKVTNRLMQIKAKPGWIIISTDDKRNKSKASWAPHVDMALSKLLPIKVHLPKLSERTDFSQIASFILSRISSEHQLSNTAVDLLRKIDRTQHINDLVNQLSTLAVQCPVGIIRAEHVDRFISHAISKNVPCPRCAENSARKAKCLEINRVFKQCNSNVAVAARKLGVSRNTVYSHIPQ